VFSRIALRMDAMMSQAIAGVMAEAFKHPEVQSLLRERLDSAPLTTSIWAIVANAISRGELPPVLLPPRVVRLPLDLLRAESILCGSPLPEETLTSMVDDVYLPLLKGLAG
jgi:hypothetical protein